MPLVRANMIHFANQSPGERYTQVKSDVDQRFPAGRFVAVEAGRIVADAETHRALVEKLRAQGQGPKDMLILEAGVEYPVSATIFAGVPSGHAHA